MTKRKVLSKNKSGYAKCKQLVEAKIGFLIRWYRLKLQLNKSGFD